MFQTEIIQEPWADAPIYKGRVFAAIFPHSDDFTIFPGGLLLKLLREGYRGYFIRTTDDMVDSLDLTPGETTRAIEGDMARLVQTMGIEKLYDFNYMNHYLSHNQIPELRHRLITLFRHLQVDTIISFDPCGHYEENPDHYITALAVEQACWMAAGRLDLPELYDMGLSPAHIRRKYYLARGPQLINRIVDISPVLTEKRACLLCNTTPFTLMAHHAGMADIASFVDARFMAPQPAYMGLEHYETYHFIES